MLKALVCVNKTFFVCFSCLLFEKIATIFSKLNNLYNTLFRFSLSNVLVLQINRCLCAHSLPTPKQVQLLYN